jgi:large repetitive protein
LVPSSLRKFLAPVMGLCLVAVAALVISSSATTAHGASTGPLKYSELPNPMERGPYAPHRTDPIVLGTYSYEEPNGKGIAPTGSDLPFENGQVRGVMFTPEGDPKKSPLIVFMAGNHGACDTNLTPSGQQGCAVYKRNDEGYAYIAENLASWGYTVYSIDEDELINRQDSSFGKGMHARRTVIEATLEKLKEASENDVPEGPNSNVGDLLDGKLDMSRIGLVGHSRGGDSVSSFLLYNQTRPKGERFPLRAVVSIAPVDYERHAPYGVPYMTIFGTCDGDVSNLQGARLYQRSLFQNDDPFPRYQVIDVGGDHNGYNTVWQVDEDDGEGADAACKPAKSIEAAEKGTGIRLSGEAGPLMGSPGNTLATSGFERVYVQNNTEKLNPEVNTEISGNPALMGDQEKLGLSTISAFLRRYVGGEGAFEPYLTGELAAEGKPSVPEAACPSSIEGKRIPCLDRVEDSYMAPPSEREDVLVPGTEDPTTVDELGTPIEASGFANPFLASGGVQPRPATTANGLAWCDPEPKQTEPGLLKEATEFPTAPVPCPQPTAHTLGGQGKDETPGAESTAEPRENAYVNASPGRQLAVAWEGPAHMSMAIPAKDGDVGAYRALYLSAAVNFFDPRNPPRGTTGIENPLYAPQNFTIAVTDAEGHEAMVEAGNPDFGTALQQTLGNTSDRVHVILQDLRVPLAEFSKQGVNLSKLRKLELRFGGEGMPSSGSIELSNIRFEQPTTGYSNIFLESTEPNAGPGSGVITSGPNPVKEYEEGVYKRADGEYEIPNVTRVPGANVWTVSNNGDCPNAQFEHIQEAVEVASPWDTIVVCPGVYEESSKPLNSEANPVSAEGEMDGLTINKPLKIIGAGASKVTIKPAKSLLTLAGATGTLRDAGGNVITVSRQSLGSTEYNENYVDISGVKIESGSDTAEAGVAFFNASGRIADSEIGTIKPVNGNGWGVVATNSIIADPVANTPERNVTLENDVIKGYSAGGVMIDDSEGGVDGASTNYVRSNMGEVGYIKGTRIEGSGGSATVGQTGVAYRSGASGSITNSTITKDHSTSTAVTSYGILAADAGPLSVKNSNITADGAKGYALYNANAEANAVSTGEAIEAIGDFWGGSTGAPVTGESVLSPSEEEGVEGPVDDTPFSATALSYPTETAVPAMPEAPPGGSIVNPTSGESVEAGVASTPVVVTEEPSVVRSVSLKANGVSVGVRGAAPYAFTWTPTKAEIGTSVELEATISTSSGQITTSTVSVPVVKSASETTAEKEAEEIEAEKAATKAAEEATAKADAELAAEAASASKLAEEAATKLAAAKSVFAEESLSDAVALAKLAEEVAKDSAAVKAEEEAKKAAAKAGIVSFAAAVKNTKAGTARLGVIVPRAGALVISGPGIKTVTKNPRGAGEVQVVITARGSALETLQKKGKVTVSVTAALSGSTKPKRVTTTVTLVKK